MELGSARPEASNLPIDFRISKDSSLQMFFQSLGLSIIGSQDKLVRAVHGSQMPRSTANGSFAEFGGEIRTVSRDRARTQVLLQAQKFRAHGSGTFGAFELLLRCLTIVMPLFRHLWVKLNGLSHFAIAQGTHTIYDIL